MSKAIAALLIGMATIGSLYALAVIVVLTVVATPTSDTTPIGYAAAERRAAAEYLAARSRCESVVSRKEKAICTAAAHAAEKQARTAAQYGYRGRTVNARIAKLTCVEGRCK
jgi:hypothetical protein